MSRSLRYCTQFLERHGDRSVLRPWMQRFHAVLGPSGALFLSLEDHGIMRIARARGTPRYGSQFLQPPDSRSPRW
jgi:hypothetical protein